MTTRTSFRPRQVDINRLLPVVRELKDLDTGDSFASRGVTHGHEGLDEENERILTVKDKKKDAGIEIPIPKVDPVPTYEKDYRPDFGDTGTYVRRPVRTRPGEFVEYDLDNEDERWLRNFNKPKASPYGFEAQAHLDEDKFELMINKLEFACAEGTERALSASSASSSTINNAVLASTIYLPRDSALDALRTETGAKHSVLFAVYEYWQQKRKRWNKPLLRRLQAPTSAADTNPYNVFRPREKIHRPQTRRRRENNVQSFEKMKELRANMEMSKELLEWVMRRERKKRDYFCCLCDTQKLKIRLHHDNKNTHEAADQEALAVAKGRAKRFAEQELKAREVEQSVNVNSMANLFPSKPLLEAFRSEEKVRKKKRRDEAGRLRAPAIQVPALPPPPEIHEVAMLFTKTFALDDLPFAEEIAKSLPPEIAKDVFRVRVARGGRLVLEQKVPASLDPFDDKAEESDPGKPRY